ncbi:MAG: signal peptidase I [bacterium]
MDSTDEMSKKRKIIYVLVTAFLIALVMRVFVVEGFIVSGDSMSPAINSGDYVFVNKLAYWHSEPKRGEVVVALPRDYPRKILKRIIGLPGERFEIANGGIIIRDDRDDPGKLLKETYLEKSDVTTIGETLTQLDPEEYFALGDNREVSIDSRELGLIDKWDIKGKVFGVINFRTLKYKGF